MIDRALNECTEPLIEGLLDQGTVNAAHLWDRQMSDKTLPSLVRLGSCSRHRERNGEAVAHRGSQESQDVLYVAAEGGKGIYRRFSAASSRRVDGSKKYIPLRLAPHST